jgi:hypothetical protein
MPLLPPEILRSRFFLRRAFTFLLASAALAVGLSAQTNTGLQGLNPTQVQAPKEGGDYSIAVTANGHWSVVITPSWVTILPSSSGDNNATLIVRVAANSESARTGDITFSGSSLKIQISQEGAGAGGGTVQLSPATISALLEGGSYSLTVTATGAWTLSTGDPWITFASAASGSGNGAVSIRVAANTGPSRTGRVSVVGGPFMEVRQAGVQDGDRLEFTPTSIQIPETGGTGTLTIKSNLSWRARPGQDWIKTSPDQGTGDGTVTYTVDPNPSPQARVGYIIVDAPFKFLSIQVDQPGSGPLALDPPLIKAPKAGGTFTITVTANGGWTASTADSWITIVSGASGRGNGTVTIQVAANPGASRNGSVSFGGSKLFTGVSQTDTGGGGTGGGSGNVQGLNPTYIHAPKDGGSYPIAITATGAWTAASSDPWITITAGASGSGNGTVTIQVAANSGPSRSGKLFAGSSLFTGVDQDGTGGGGSGSSITVTPDSLEVPAVGGLFTVQVNAPGDWAAVGEVYPSGRESVLVAPASGHGNTQVSLVFPPNWNSDPMSGGRAMTVNGSRLVQFQQAKLGDVTVSPTLVILPYNDSASGTIHVTSTGPWIAVPQASWIRITSGASGNGNGDIYWAVAADASRMEGEYLNVNHTQVGFRKEVCSTGYKVIPLQWSAPPQGGTFDVRVDTGADACHWSAQPDAAWITVVPSSGAGSATITLQAQPNPGPARQASVIVRDKTFSVQQPKVCTATVSPTSLNLGAAAASGSLNIVAAADCGWGAAAEASWVTWEGPTTGLGPGTVRYVAAANGSTKGRATVIYVGGNNIPVAQAGAPCAYVVSAQAGMLPAAGGSVRLSLLAPSPDCTWTGASSQSWASFAPANGFGNSAITVTTSPNPGADPRSVVISVGGQQVVLTQAGAACTYAVSPASVDVPAEARSGALQVQAGASCSWTASTADPWITLSGGTSGSGGGTFSYRTAANDSLQSRAGVIQVGGARFAVRQSGAACEYTLPADATLLFSADGGQIPVQVTPNRQDCSEPQSVLATADWLTTKIGWAPGGGLIVVTAAPKTDAGSRSARILVQPSNSAGLDVTQSAPAAAAAYSVTPNYL